MQDRHFARRWFTREADGTFKVPGAGVGSRFGNQRHEVELRSGKSDRGMIVKMVPGLNGRRAGSWLETFDDMEMGLLIRGSLC